MTSANYVFNSPTLAATTSATASSGWTTVYTNWTLPNRTQILPGVYLNMDKHTLERI